MVQIPLFTANYLSQFSSSPAFPSLVWASRLGLWGGTAPCWGVRVHPALGHFAALVLPRFCRALSGARGGQPLGGTWLFQPEGIFSPRFFRFLNTAFFHHAGIKPNFKVLEVRAGSGQHELLEETRTDLTQAKWAFVFH